MAIVIDFAGKAGSGKTFVKNETIKRLSSNARCLDISDTVLTAGEHFHFFFSEPAATIASIAFILSGIPRSYHEACRLLRTWFSIQIRIKKARTHEYDFCFIDEGLFRKLSLMRDGALKRLAFSDIPAFIRQRLLYPDVTVYVSADYALCEKRRMARDFGTSKFRPESPIARGLSAMEELERDLSNAQENGFVKVIRYDNNDIFDPVIVRMIYETKNANRNML